MERFKDLIENRNNHICYFHVIGSIRILNPPPILIFQYLFTKFTDCSNIITLKLFFSKYAIGTLHRKNIKYRYN